jgi:hypothetical protein
MQASRSTARGSSVSYVGAPHSVRLKSQELFYGHIHLYGGPARARRLLPEFVEVV